MYINKLRIARKRQFVKLITRISSLSETVNNNITCLILAFNVRYFPAPEEKEFSRDR